MATIEKALQIAAKAHEGQKDKEGMPYILHPLRVMAEVEGEDAKIVAVLHDTIEDTSVTADDLRQVGFSEKVVAAVLCVTHHRDEPYADYVVRCKGNEVARRVKLADLEDNSRLSRTILRPHRLQVDLARIRRYFLSYKFLTDQITEEQYRTLMEEDGGSRSMNELTALETVELMPVIELTPGTFSTQERPSPSGSGREMPQEWNRYWLESLADASVVGLTPLWPWSWLVPTRQLTDGVVLNRILSTLVREWGGPEVFSDPDSKPVLDGGLTLCCRGEVLVAPTCCGDLGDLSDWREAVACRQSDWGMLWIGHPWLSIRFTEDRLILSKPHESDSPVAQWTVTPDELGRAVAEAEAELERFARRLEPILTFLGCKNNPTRAARRLVGLQT